MSSRQTSQLRGPSLGLSVTLPFVCIVLTSPLVVTRTCWNMLPIQIGCGPCAGISGGMDHCGMCVAYRRRISCSVISSSCHWICIRTISLYRCSRTFTRSLICLETCMPSGVMYPPAGLKVLPIGTASRMYVWLSLASEICR